VRKHGRADAKPAAQDDTMSLSWATALAHAVDERITVRHAHARRVAQFAHKIAKGLDWDDDHSEMIEIAAVLHDVGKVAVPDRVLRKEQPLSAEDWMEIRNHPVAGAEIVARIKGLEQIVPWIRHSREHFDGSGYPDGLGGDAIPFESRILAVATAFDGMTSDRAWRPAISAADALDELRQAAGTQFDPECVALFEQHVVATFERV